MILNFLRRKNILKQPVISKDHALEIARLECENRGFKWAESLEIQDGVWSEALKIQEKNNTWRFILYPGLRDATRYIEVDNKDGHIINDNWWEPRGRDKLR